MKNLLNKCIPTILAFSLFATHASAMFITPDPYDPTHPGVGTNRFSYSLNDPINNSDKNGNYCLPCGYAAAIEVLKWAGIGIGVAGAGGAIIHQHSNNNDSDGFPRNHNNPEEPPLPLGRGPEPPEPPNAGTILAATFVGVYEANPKHDRGQIGDHVGPQPVNPTQTLETSFEVTETSRVGYDPTAGQFVGFQYNGSTWHGYASTWNDLPQRMQNALIKNGVVRPGSKGKLTRQMKSEIKRMEREQRRQEERTRREEEN